MFLLLFSAFQAKPPGPGPKPVPTTGKCQACRLITKAGRKVLKLGSTQEEMDKFLRTACNRLPSTTKTDCKSFLEESGKELFDIIKNGGNSKTACIKVKACVKDPKPPKQ
jgi:hypothetical protein